MLKLHKKRLIITINEVDNNLNACKHMVLHTVVHDSLRHFIEHMVHETNWKWWIEHNYLIAYLKVMDEHNNLQFLLFADLDMITEGRAKLLDGHARKRWRFIWSVSLPIDFEFGFGYATGRNGIRFWKRYSLIYGIKGWKNMNILTFFFGWKLNWLNAVCFKLELSIINLYISFQLSWLIKSHNYRLIIRKRCIKSVDTDFGFINSVESMYNICTEEIREMLLSKW